MRPGRWAELCDAARRHAPALLLFLVLAVLTTHPFGTQPAGRVPANADAVHGAFTIAHLCNALLHDPSRLWSANMFHPDSSALLYQDTLLGGALFGLPLCPLASRPALLFNLLSVFTLAACAAAAYALVLELLASRWAGVVAGSVFAFSTANYDTLARLQTLSCQWTPLVLLFLVRLVRRRRLGDGLLLGASLGLQGLSASYYGLYLVSLLVLTLPWLFLRLPRPRLLHVPWKGLVLGAVVTGALMLPLVLAQRQHLSGLESRRVLRTGALPGTSWLQTLPENWLYGAQLGRLNVSYDDRYFCGFLPVLLAAAGVWTLGRRQLARATPGAQADAAGWLRYLLIFGVLAFLLGAGRTLSLPMLGDVPGPYAWLHAHAPGFGETRVPSRFAMFARLTLAVVAALGAACLARLLPRPGARWVASIGLLLLPLEHLSVPLPAWEVPEGARLPAVYAWLRGLPERAVVLEFPPAPPRGRRAEALWVFLAAQHRQALVNGYSSFQPAQHALVLDELLASFPSRSSVMFLRRLGVDYLVVHRAWSRNFEESAAAYERFAQNVGRFPEELVLVRRFADDGVYDGPLGRLGGEEVYRLAPRDLPPLPAALGPAARLAPSGWTCDSQPADGGCQLALDGSLSTAFSTGRGQRRGDFVGLRFPAPLRASAVVVRSGGWPACYPREPEVWGLVTGLGWRRLAQRFDASALLAALLARDRRAGLELTFEPVDVTELQVRLRRPPFPSERWSAAEIEVHGPRLER